MSELKMSKGSAKNCMHSGLPLVCLLIGGLYAVPALSEWSVKQQPGYYNGGYGDFPPQNINELLNQKGLAVQEKAKQDVEASAPSAEVMPKPSAAPKTQSSPGQRYAAPPAYPSPYNGGYGQSGGAYPGSYPGRYSGRGPQYYNRNQRNSNFSGPWNNNRSGFNGPWNNNRSNFSGPWDSNGSNFSGPWNNNGSSFSAPWDNNGSSFSPWGGRGGWW